MAWDNWKVYTKAKEYIADNTIDLDNGGSGDFKIILLTSGHTPSLALQHLATSQIATAGKRCTNGGGTAQGIGIATWTPTGTSMKFSSAVTGLSWTATTGGFSAAYAILYADYVASPTDPLACYVGLTSDGSGVSVSAGNTFTLNLATGAPIFTLSGATS